MKVFISWSGERSRKVAELLDEWLQCVIQAIEPWISSKDIDRGSLWFSEIADQLKDVGVGIICVTKENKEKPWILFEAGSLAKGLKNNRVCTFLVDLQPQDIEDPLAQFNHTLPNKANIFALIRTLNNALGDDKLKDKVLESVFETYWPSFEKSFNLIIKDTPETTPTESRSADDILNEILLSTRSLEKRLSSLERNVVDYEISNTIQNPKYNLIKSDSPVTINRFSDPQRTWLVSPDKDSIKLSREDISPLIDYKSYITTIKSKDTK